MIIDNLENEEDRRLMSATANNQVFFEGEDKRKKRALKTGYTTGTSASAAYKGEHSLH